MSASPFDQLLRMAAGQRARPPMPVPVRREGGTTKVATLLGYLREAGPASTSTLCHLVELDSRLVWGLLKAPRDRGEVIYSAERWSVVDGFDAEERANLMAAARMLRRHGWTVRAPATRGRA